MLSERLRERPLFTWREDKPLEGAAQDLINRSVRRLVLLMRTLETRGVASREAIEVAVLRAFEASELVYYGFDADEIDTILRLERKNEESRSKARR